MELSTIDLIIIGISITSWFILTLELLFRLKNKIHILNEYKELVKRYKKEMEDKTNKIVNQSLEINRLQNVVKELYNGVE